MGYYFPPKAFPGYSGCRLSLSSSDPAPTSDVTAATTLYLLPHLDDRIVLAKSSGQWREYAVGSSGLSLSLSGIVAGTNYDVYCRLDSSGVPELVLGSGWTNDTTRSVALSRYDGVLCYLVPQYKIVGTIRASANDQCEDSFAKRFLWNDYNQIWRASYNSDSNAHTYASATVQEWGASGTPFGRCQFVLGQARIVNAELSVVAANQALARVGFDTTTSGENPIWYASGVAAGTRYTQLVAPKSLAAGFHYATVNENCNGGTSSSFANAYLRVHILG